MGVHGITRFLEEKGLLPTGSTDCCCPDLWKEWNASMAFRGMTGSPVLQTIPPRSKIFLDGNGLAFHLYQIAHARHMQSLFPRETSPSCPKVKSLGATEITMALPVMMPLQLVRQVTIEFATSLSQQDLNLRCYWDGPSRSFKSKTLSKRKIEHQQEWAALQTFCNHGTLPMQPTARICGCLREFPLPRLVILSVKHALASCSVEMVQCDEEADAVMAKEASGDQEAFVVGRDSDFLFYRDIQYIPLGGVYMPSKTINPNIRVHACCLTRKGIAESLGLSDNDMVELAILLGNDYVDPSTLDVPPELKSTTDRIAFLQDKVRCDQNYRLQMMDGSTQELQYVRSLYNFEEFDFSIDDDDDESSAESDVEDPVDLIEEQVMCFPEDFPLNQAVLSPQDTSVRNAVVRCLQAYLDHCSTGSMETHQEPPALHQAHLDAYQSATMPFVSAKQYKLTRRPTWEDVRAAFVIDVCIAHTLRRSAKNGLVLKTPPDALMNHVYFHAIMAALQKEDIQNSEIEPPVADPEPTETPCQTVERPLLPIDEHEEKIITTIRENRVTIIHGETGCGKSSRVPVMILEAPSPEPSLPTIKMFISQPRRIAAASLVDRVRSCEPNHREKFALRMGHGHREYESSQTQAWFVTTGYLTRLLANHPERFKDVTHLIIDEVHERSVDTDILCLLCRRLLENNKKIRIVLMSATLASKIYQDYFKVPHDPIHVGVRRFPIKEFYVEDLHAHFKLPPKEQNAVNAIRKECESMKCKSSPTASQITSRFSLAARLVTIVASPGTSVLIFVPGISEIIAITEAVEQFYQPGVTYTCYPIHSEVPFEDQMGAFDNPTPDEVKVIIATNAAESSVTLPAVDHVICLGLCRQIMYNESSHRQILTSCWISRASATQRAGRTGRLRPGNVYRLYTRETYENYMAAFEQGEMLRIPLDSVILMLKQMLHEQTIPVLLDCLEPPPMTTIENSFASLHDWNLLTEPSDQGDITTLGSFVTALGVDLALGCFIGLGIQFGVAAEAIEMAASLSFPKSPFQISNPLIHPPNEYNDIISKVYVSKSHFDANLYSEPMALMNALWEYKAVQDKSRWCQSNRISHARIRQLQSTKNTLERRVADFLGVPESKLQVISPPVHMPHYKARLLRVLKVWVFSDSIVECRPPKVARSPDGSVEIQLPRNQTISDEQLKTILSKDRHPYKVVENRRIEGRGTFEIDQNDFSLENSVEEMQGRLVSYMCETRITIATLEQDNVAFAFIDTDLLSHTQSEICAMLSEDVALGLLVSESDAHLKRRGILERNCGLWKVSQIKRTIHDFSKIRDTGKKCFLVLQDTTSSQRLLDQVRPALKNDAFSAMLYLYFPKDTKKNKKKKSSAPQYHYFLNGSCQPISKVDMQDLLSALSVTISHVTSKSSQTINFLRRDNEPIQGRKKAGSGTASKSGVIESSWQRPLFQDIPEGARVLSVLASGVHRGSPRIQFIGTDEDGDETSTTVYFNEEEVGIGRRWYRFGSDRPVYVDKTSVPSSATNGSIRLIACCANTLELKGGGLKVEGMTMLPPNPLFLLLCRLSFGLAPDIDLKFRSMSGEKSDNATEMAEKALSWLRTREQATVHGSGDSFSPETSADKIQMAIDFHQSCSSMGESLICFPDKVRELCVLLDGLDGYNAVPTGVLEENELTPENLCLWKQQKKEQARIAKEQAPTNKALPSTLESAENDESSRISTVSSLDKVSNATIDDQKGASKNGDAPRRRKKKWLAQQQSKEHTQRRNGPVTATKALPSPIESAEMEESSKISIVSLSEKVSKGATGDDKIASKHGNARKRRKKKRSAQQLVKELTQLPNEPATTTNALPSAAESAEIVESSKISTASLSKNESNEATDDHKMLPNNSSTPKRRNLRTFSSETHENAKRMFATSLHHGAEFLSTNMLAMAIHEVAQIISKRDDSKPVKSKHASVQLNKANWEIIVHENEDGQQHYQAKFKNTLIALTPLSGRGKNKLPKWMKKSVRPARTTDVKECIPPTMSVPEPFVVCVSKDTQALAFKTIEDAIKMEAAFYLERQLAVAGKTSCRHWFDYDITEIIEIFLKSVQTQ